MSTSYARASRLASSSPKHFDFHFFTYQNETEYTFWWSTRRVTNWFRALPDNTLWNCGICISTLAAIVLTVLELHPSHWVILMDAIFNVLYMLHVIGTCYNDHLDLDNAKMPFTMIRYAVDGLSYLHYVAMLLYYLGKINKRLFVYAKVCLYYLRLHRPFKFLLALNDKNLKGSVVGTTLKYLYIFLVMRVTGSIFWLNLDDMLQRFIENEEGDNVIDGKGNERLGNTTAENFYRAFYIINKIFKPIGPAYFPSSDGWRAAFLVAMLSGSLLLNGIAIASLALVIGLYMRPEEVYRERFRLIMKDLKESHVLEEQCTKVETFYRMYWHKQKGVSEARLLPTFPPTLSSTVYTDVYFEAQQKSRILCDLSYQFLSEIAKVMTTIHFIPGDAIIKRNAFKSAIYYISYGDVEMLTAEDDMTPILRFTRGSILSACGGCVSCACCRSHVQMRAATYCTAQVLKATDLWHVAVKHGKGNGQNFILHSSLEEHLERVKRHYAMRTKQQVKYLSSIVQLKHNLIAMKEVCDESGKLLLERNDIFLEISGCYIMRNRNLRSLSDESDAICLRSTFPCILQPQSSLQTVWSSFVAMIILLVTFTHPYNLVYLPEVSLSFRFYDYAVTVIFILDILVHLSTGANAEEGVPITFRQTSMQQMNSEWLILDVLGTLPIFELLGEGNFAGMNKLLRLPKIFRVLKSMEAVAVYHSHVLRFSSYFLLFFIACFLAATLNQAFMCWQFGYCIITNMTTTPYWVQAPLDEDTVDDRITFGLFWAVSMLTFTADKIGSWDMNSWYMSIFTLFMLEITGILHIFIGSVYSATIMVTTSMREEFEDSISTVKNFLIRNNVDPALLRRFVQYLQLCWYTDKAYSMTHKKQSIFFDLPQHVYQDLLAMQRSKYILSVPIMKFLSNEALKEVSSQSRLFYTSPNEILLNTGDIVNEIYIIKRGTCQVLDPETEDVVNVITVKDHFGDLECLMRFPAYYTVRAVTHVQIFSLSRKFFLEYLKVPQIKNTLDFVKKRKEYKSLLQRREPFVWYEPPPPAPNRQFFKLPRKHEPDTAFQQPFQRLGFLSVLRYIFPRYTLRPDGKYLRRYEVFRGAAALTSSLVFPSLNYMSLQFPWIRKLATFLDITAYYDICQRMLVAYYNEEGILVYHPAATAGHYLKGAFWVDFVACFPLEFLDTGRKPTYKGRRRHTASYQLLMLNRLVQLYRLLGAMDIIGEGVERADIMLVIKFIPLFMTLASVITCLIICWELIITRAVEGYGWFLEPVSDNNWVVAYNDTFRFNITESPLNLHLATYFWVIYEITCVGYNVFNPVSYTCTLFLTIGIILGYMMITYSSVRVISIRSSINKPLASFQENIKDILLYMKQEKLSKGLRSEVMRYYEYNWDKMGGTNYRSVLKLCDQITLRTDAILHIYGRTFSKCSILYGCDFSLLRMVGRGVKSVYYQQGSHIIETDDVISDMFFVDHGTVDVKQDSSEMNLDEFTVSLQRGSLFGNLDPALYVRYSKTVVAKTNVHLLQINSLTFHKIIQDFPSVKDLMKKHRQQNEVYIMGSSGDPGHKHWKEITSSKATLSGSKKGKLQSLLTHDFIIMFYLIVVSLLCFYVDVYNAGFQDNRVPIIVFLYIMDMGFFFKILLNCSMPYLVNETEDKLLMYRKRSKYLNAEFRYDIASCLPMELICLIRSSDRWLWWSLLRINRLLRVVTVYQCLKRHKKKLNINLVLSTIVSVAIWFTLLIHVTTCLWYAIGIMEDGIVANSSWQYDKNGDPVCDNKYICALYFIMTTFTQNGVGDIMPMTRSEVVFVSILLICSTMVFMIYVGEFSNIIQYQQFRCFTYYSMHMELQEFLSNNRVSTNLVKMVDRYVLHLWRKTRGLQMPTFLVTAPPVLKQKIMGAAYMHHILAHPVFQNCEPAFLRQLVGCLKLYIYNDEMQVVKENEITNAMYFVHTGRVQESAEDLEQITGVFTAGQHFGTYNGLHRDTAYNNTYKTIASSQVLTLHLNDWEYLLKHFPKCKEAIYGGSDYKPNDDNNKSKKGDGKNYLIAEDGDVSETSLHGITIQQETGEQGKLEAAPTTPLQRPPAAAASAMTSTPAAVTEDGGIAAAATTPATDRMFPASWRERPNYSHQPEPIKKEKPTVTKHKEKNKKVITLKENSSGDESDDDDFELTPDKLNRPSFVQKAMASAKKFLGKDIDQEAEGKDDLLIAQDEATTAALLKSIEQQASTKFNRNLISDSNNTQMTIQKKAQEETEPQYSKKEDLLRQSFSLLSFEGSQTDESSLNKFIEHETRQEKQKEPEPKEADKPIKMNLLFKIDDPESEDKHLKSTTSPSEFKPTTAEDKPKIKTIDDMKAPITDDMKSKIDEKKLQLFDEPAIGFKTNSQKFEQITSSPSEPKPMVDPVEEINEDDLEEPLDVLNLPKTTDDIDDNELIFPESKRLSDEEDSEVKNIIKPRPKGVDIAETDNDKLDNDDEDVEQYMEKITKKETKYSNVEKQEPEHDESKHEKILHRRPTAFPLGKSVPSQVDSDNDEDEKVTNDMKLNYPIAEYDPYVIESKHENKTNLQRQPTKLLPSGYVPLLDKDDQRKDKDKHEDKTLTKNEDSGLTHAPKSTNIDAEESLWPLDSRRRSTVENMNREDVQVELQKLADKLAKERSLVSPLARRRSTIENVDKKAVEAELAALSSPTPSDMEFPVPLDNIHRSTVDNFNKQAVEQELSEKIDFTDVAIQIKEPEEEEYEPDDSFLQLANQRRSTISRFIGTAKKAFTDDKKKGEVDTLLREQDEATTEALLKTYEDDIHHGATYSHTEARKSADSQKHLLPTVAMGPVPSLLTIASVVSEASMEDLTKKDDEKQRISRRTTRVRYVEEPEVTAITDTDFEPDIEVQTQNPKKAPQKPPKDLDDV